MSLKLFDSELKVMELLWKNGEMTAKQISDQLNQSIGWNINTTYTVIKKCIKKGAIERRDPHFLCYPLVKKEEIQAQETQDLIDRVFDGMEDRLFASLVERKKLTPKQKQKLYDIVSSWEED